ncbi:MAG: hypothetical protein ABIK28_02130, partial [Planctomycetota bacterium]
PMDYKNSLSIGRFNSDKTDPTQSADPKKLSMTELAKQMSKLRNDLQNLQNASSVDKLPGVGGPPRSISSVSSKSSLGFSDLSSDISEISQLSGVKSGTFSINDVTFSVDTNHNSLGDIISDINNSTAGVKASFNAAESKIQIRSVGAWEQFTLSDGTSGLFTELNVTEGAHGSANVPEMQKFIQSEKFGKDLADFAKSFQDFFASEFDVVAKDEGEKAITSLKEAVKDVFKEVFSITDKDELESHMGISFNFDESSEEVMHVDTRKLSSSMDFSANTFANFILGKESAGSRAGGFLSAIDSALDKISESLVPKLGPGEDTGLSLNISA